MREPALTDIEERLLDIDRRRGLDTVSLAESERHQAQDRIAREYLSLWPYERRDRLEEARRRAHTRERERATQLARLQQQSRFRRLAA